MCEYDIQELLFALLFKERQYLLTISSMYGSVGVHTSARF